MEANEKIESQEQDELALQELAKSLSQYWKLKTAMTKGSEPPHIASLLAQLSPYCMGLSLCGAGAGGFAVCILRQGALDTQHESSFDALRRVVESLDPTLSVHRIEVDLEGVTAIELIAR